MTLVAAAAAMAAVLMAWPRASRLLADPRVVRPRGAAASEHQGRRRPAALRRLVVAAAAGVGAWLVLGGTVGLVAAGPVGLLALVVLRRAEPAAVRREREEAARELPHLVSLLAATLRAGAAPLDGLATATAALPGPAARRVAPMLEAVRFGGSLSGLDALLDDDVLAPLARSLARAERSGSSVVDAVEQLADELEREAGAAAEDAARRVGVAAAVPLGVCLLPAFLLIGIVPTVAGLLSEVTR